MNLLVTGGAGFIGTNLIHHVIDRPEVAKLVNLDCLTYAGHEENLCGVARHPKYTFVTTDLRDKQAVLDVVRGHRISHVIHLAAESHVDRSIAGPDDFITTNIVGTFHLLEACRASWFSQNDALCPSGEDRRFLQVSTDEVFGSLGPSGVFSENSPYAPNSPYSASKAAGDHLVHAYHHTYGLPALISRSSNNYGPFQFPEKLIPLAIRCLLARTPVPVYGDGLQVRDWLHVCDHSEALWRILTRGRPGQTYNVSGQNECTNLLLLERICDIFDTMRPEAGGNSRRLLTFVRDRPGHDRRYSINSEKIRHELSWAPATDFEHGIRETIRWYLNHQEWLWSVWRAHTDIPNPTGSRN